MWKIWFAAGLVVSLLSIGTTQAKAVALFGFDADTQQLIAIDAATGVGTSVGPVGLPLSIGGLAFNADGTLFGYDRDGLLVTLNTSTGAATIVGGGVGGTGIAFAADNTLYGAARTGGADGGGQLIIIDPSTGSTMAVVGSFNVGPLEPQALAFNEDGTLFGLFGDLSTINLGIVDVATGAVQLEGPALGEEIKSLAFDADGTLFGVSTFPSDGLFEIFETGGVDFPAVGSVGFGGISAIAFAPQAVPSPSTLATLGFGLAGLAWMRRRPA